MTHMRMPARVLTIAALGAAAITLPIRAQDTFQFQSGVDLVNVTATVTDEDGHFVPGLGRSDFAVFDDGVRQEITHFSNERVPVSLGILLDISGSMTPEKMSAARAAIDRFVVDLLGSEDEVFFIEFSDATHIVQDWTSDRARIARAADRVQPGGGTALYDAIADALPIAVGGRHEKKALLVLSDGNDTISDVPVVELRQAIRESEVLVYALGVDSSAPVRRLMQPPAGRQPTQPRPRPPAPRGPGVRRPFPIFDQLIGGARPRGLSSDRVNVDALRRITDDTGGRTEVIREFDDLKDATARIADELSRQYSLGYASPRQRDGRWHTIRVEVRRGNLTVRARRGYLAS